MTIAMDPVIFRIGPVAFQWHGLFSALAIAVGVSLSIYLARHKGLPEDEMYTLALWAVIGGFIGGRLLPVIENLGYYLNNPTQIIAVQTGGLAIYGGILGGTVAGVVFAKLRRIPVGRLADVVAPGLVLGQAIGRIGCTINGDAWGAPSDLPWAITYTHPDAFVPPSLLGVPTHPTPVYELLWDLVVFAIVWKLRKRPLPDGQLFLGYLTLYSTGRFFISFLRQDLVILWGLRQAQLIGILVLLVAVPMMVYLARTKAPQERPSPLPH